MPAILAPVLRARFFDANGNPLAGGRLFSYQAGTSTPQATYTDHTAATPNTNPVILDANGEADIWIDPTLSYHFVLQDVNEVQQWTIDNVIAAQTTLRDATDSTKLVVFDLAGSTSGTSATFDINNTTDRTYTMPNASGTVALTTLNVATQTTTATIGANDDVTFASSSGGAYTLTLPTGVTGKQIRIQKTSSDFNQITIGAVTSIHTQGESVVLLYDGSAWQVVDRHIPSTWTAYTPIFTGAGTVTDIEIYYKRNRTDILLRGTYTTAAGTATETRTSLPSGLTSAGAGVIGTIEVAGTLAASNAGVAVFFVLMEPSVAYTTVGIQDATRAGQTKQNGADVYGSGDVWKFSASVPIAGWNG